MVRRTIGVLETPPPPRSGSLHPAWRFLLHLLLVAVGGNWSSIRAHSCSRGCRGYRRAGSSWVSRQPLCRRWTTQADVRGRGGVTQAWARPRRERVAAPGSRSGDSGSIFLQSQLLPFKCEGLCSHRAVSWELLQGRAPSHAAEGRDPDNAPLLSGVPSAAPQAARALGS